MFVVSGVLPIPLRQVRNVVSLLWSDDLVVADYYISKDGFVVKAHVHCPADGSL